MPAALAFDSKECAGQRSLRGKVRYVRQNNLASCQTRGQESRRHAARKTLRNPLPTPEQGGQAASSSLHSSSENGRPVGVRPPRDRTSKPGAGGAIQGIGTRQYGSDARSIGSEAR